MDYSSITAQSIQAAFDLATNATSAPTDTESANAFAARIQSLLEIAKITGALGAANDAIAANNARQARDARLASATAR